MRPEICPPKVLGGGGGENYEHCLVEGGELQAHSAQGPGTAEMFVLQ